MLRAYKRKTKNYIKKSKKALTKEDHKFLKQLLALQKKSTCLRAHVASIIVDKNNKVIAEGTNSYHPIYSCKKIGCIRDIRNTPSGSNREICYGLCAEQYLISQAAKDQIPTQDTTIYVTTHPCRICECLIVSADIKRVVYVRGYPDVLPQFDPFKKHGIELIHAKEYDTLPKPFDV